MKELFIRIQYEGEEYPKEKAAKAIMQVFPGRMKKRTIIEVKIRDNLDALLGDRENE